MAHCGRCATPPPVPQPGRVAFQGSRGALGPVWATEQGLTGVVRPSGTKVRALKGFDDALRQVRGSPSQLGGGGGRGGGGTRASRSGLSDVRGGEGWVGGLCDGQAPFWVEHSRRGPAAGARCMASRAWDWRGWLEGY